MEKAVGIGGAQVGEWDWRMAAVVGGEQMWDIVHM